MIEENEILNDRYEILRPLGAGGMGVVHVARRLSLGDTVAIKQLHASLDSPDARRRFETEARAAAFIRHPNVVEVFDFGHLEDGRPYLVMEHLEGPTLSGLLREQGRLDPDRALELFAPMCAAVEAGHRRGILHRDLKPANVIIARRDDGSEQVKVLDFGLARFEDGAEPGVTRPGTVLGTVEYMAPELVADAVASAASDVWALGVILYEMVTGRLPIVADTPMALMYRIAIGEWKPAEQVVPELPRAILDALRAAAQKGPSDRPTSPELLARMASPSKTRSRRPPPPPPARVVAEDAPTIESRVGSSPRARTALHEPRFKRFVGRESERIRVQEMIDDADSGRGKIVVVSGATGVGKSALLDRVAIERGAAGERALRARFFSYEGSRPPALETFTAMLPGVSPSRLAVPDLDEGARWSLREALTDEFCALGREPALTLIFDDVQWATPFELETIEHLHRALAPQGIAIMVSARDDAGGEVDGWVGRMLARRDAALITLGPFDEQAIRAYLRSCFGALTIRPADLQRLLELTGGNPLFLTELVRKLFADGRITFGESAWAVAPLGGVTLPAEASDLVLASIDAVESPLRAMLESAAVIGDRFRFETLQHASGIDEDSLDSLLERGVRRGLLREDAGIGMDDFSFVSPVVRSALYQALPRRKRRRMHERVVDALRRLYAPRLERLAPVLAYHYDAVGDAPRAFETGLIAAERALGEHDVAGAAVALDRATRSFARIERRDEMVGERCRLDLAVGTLGVRTGVRLDEALAALTRVRIGAAPACQLLACMQLGRGALAKGEHERALDALGSAIELAAQLEDREALARARLTRAIVLLRNGSIPEAAAQTDEVLAGATADAPLSLRAAAERHRAWIALKTGEFARAQDHARRSLEFARASGDLVTQQLCVGALAAVFGEGGDQERSLPLELRALELARRAGDRRREAISLANTGEAFYRLERFDEALAHFDEALSIFVEIGDRACEGDCRVNVGRGLLASGLVDDAIDMLRRGQGLCSATGRVEYAAIAALCLGRAAIEKGDAAAASRAYSRSRGQLITIESHLLWQAELGLALAAELGGDLALAQQHAERAATLVHAQRDRLPAGTSLTSFEQETAPVFQLLEELGA